MRELAALRPWLFRIAHNRAIEPSWCKTPFARAVDGREVLAVVAQGASGTRRHIIELAWRDGHVIAIRDFRYVSYIAQDAAVVHDA